MMPFLLSPHFAMLTNNSKVSELRGVAVCKNSFFGMQISLQFSLIAVGFVYYLNSFHKVEREFGVRD